MADPYRFIRQARRPGTALAVAGTWAALLAARVFLDAASWLMALIALFTLPALWDLIRNPSAGLTLDTEALHWHSGQRSASVALDEIDHVRLDTRLDFSVRASVQLRSGRKIRLPFESTPPHLAFEAALQERGIKVQRHHFQLRQ